MKIRILFLCATNGVQSPMAEALLKRLDSAHFDVTSAGIDRGEMHPLMIEVMKEVGIDLEGKVPKGTHDVSNLGFDFVITLCDRARTACLEFPKAELTHWRFDDPLVAMADTKRKRLFQSLRDQIAHRIRLFALVQVRFAPIEKYLEQRSAVSSSTANPAHY
jgi:arsenate reductase (thioredoxin)